MIHTLLAFNSNHGIRVSKFYSQPFNQHYCKVQSFLIENVPMRSSNACNFFPFPATVVSSRGPTEHTGKSLTVVYRRFNSLFFALVQDSEDDELLALNVLTLIVQAFDLVFVDVKEMDILLDFELSNFIVDEIILGGEIQETNLEIIKDAVKLQQMQANIDMNSQPESLVVSFKELVKKLQSPY